MDKYIKVIEARIQSYKNALELTDKYLKIDMHKNFEQSNFEKNLMSSLMTRVELKERIDELEYVKQLLSIKGTEENEIVFTKEEVDSILQAMISSVGSVGKILEDKVYNTLMLFVK